MILQFFSRRALAQQKERAKLDSTDWSKKPYITSQQLFNMSAERARQVLTDIPFSYCPNRQIYINLLIDLVEGVHHV